MHLKVAVSLALVASLFPFAIVRAAEHPAQDIPSQTAPAQSKQVQQQSAGPAAPGQRRMGRGMMTPDMMRMMASMMGGAQGAAGRSRMRGGPLQRVSRLLAAVDDPRVRTALGLTDQQADSLRKIIIDTETFTITTGASMLVDSIELRELLRADKPDKNAVMKEGNEISKSTSQLINRYLDAILSAKAILTPEQQRMIRLYVERGSAPPPARP
ncbi:MAG: Spy/CpxP family protein refolding chaperone [Candidatus Acidiferrales bacterium]